MVLRSRAGRRSTGPPPSPAAGARVVVRAERPTCSAGSQPAQPGRTTPGLVGDDHHLRAVARTELGRRAQHVGLDGQRAEEQALADLVVRQPLGDEHQHLALARGEVRERRRLGDLPRRAGDGGQQPPRDGRREQRVTGRDDAHGAQQVRRLGVLDQEPRRTPADRLGDVLVELERGHDDHAHARRPRFGDDPPGRGQAVGPRHPDVHQHDVRQQLEGQPHGLVPGRRLPDDRQVGLGVRAAHGSRRAPAPGRRRAGRGSPVTSRELEPDPEPRRPGPATSVPPTDSARSRMPRRP